MSNQTVFLGLWQGASAAIVCQLMMSKWPPSQYRFRSLRASPAVSSNECILGVASLYRLETQTDQKLTELESEYDPNALYAKVCEAAQSEGGLCVLDFCFLQNVNSKLNWPLVIAFSYPSFEHILPEQYEALLQTLQPVNQTPAPQWPLGLGPARAVERIPVGVISSRVADSPEFQRYIEAVVNEHRKKLSAAVAAEGEKVKGDVKVLEEKLTCRTQEISTGIKANCSRIEESVAGLKRLKEAIEVHEFPQSTGLRLTHLREKVAEGHAYIASLRSRLGDLAHSRTNPVPPACIMRVEPASFSLNVYVANFKQRFAPVVCCVEEGNRQVVKTISEGLKPGICCIHVKNALVGFKSQLSLTLFGEAGGDRFPLTRPYNCSLSLLTVEPRLEMLRAEPSEAVTMEWAEFRWLQRLGLAPENAHVPDAPQQLPAYSYYNVIFDPYALTVDKYSPGQSYYGQPYL